MGGLTRRSRTQDQLGAASSGTATCADQLDVAFPGAAPCADPHGFRPHDLIWVAEPAALRWRGNLPEWCAYWLQCGAPTPVVLRRENTGDPDLLPVGIRGVHRHQRQAAYLERHAVARILPPEQLVRSIKMMDGTGTGTGTGTVGQAHQSRQESGAPEWLPGTELSVILHSLLSVMSDIGLPWGPTGSLGFALATGLPALHEGSDIDLLVRAPAPLSQDQVRALAALVEGSARPIDMQIDTGFGGFAFKEWVACDPERAGRGARRPGSEPRRVLLKTGAGPILVHDPWRRVPIDRQITKQPWPVPTSDFGKAESEDPFEQEEAALANAGQMAVNTGDPSRSA